MKTTLHVESLRWKYYFEILDMFKVNKTKIRIKSIESSCAVFVANFKHMKYISVQLLFQFRAYWAIKPFYANAPFLLLLKTSENQRLSWRFPGV